MQQLFVGVIFGLSYETGCDSDLQIKNNESKSHDVFFFHVSYHCIVFSSSRHFKSKMKNYAKAFHFLRWEMFQLKLVFCVQHFSWNFFAPKIKCKAKWDILSFLYGEKIVNIHCQKIMKITVVFFEFNRATNKSGRYIGVMVTCTWNRLMVSSIHTHNALEYIKLRFCVSSVHFYPRDWKIECAESRARE